MNKVSKDVVKYCLVLSFLAFGSMQTWAKGDKNKDPHVWEDINEKSTKDCKGESKIMYKGNEESVIPVNKAITITCTHEVGNKKWDHKCTTHSKVFPKTGKHERSGGQSEISWTISGAATGSGSNNWGTSVTPTEPGEMTVSGDLSCDDCSASISDSTVTVVGVGKIELLEGSKSLDSDVTTDLVVLKGTKYTFKAIPDPSGTTWPPNQPTWSGIVDGTGETIDVTFDTTGSYKLICKCDTGDKGVTVNIEVLTLEVTKLEFKGEEIKDMSNEWTSEKNDPACFVAGATTTVDLTLLFKDSSGSEKDLSHDTKIKLSGDVNSSCEEMTGGDYDDFTKEHTVKSSNKVLSGITSKKKAGDKIKYKENVNIAWKYKVPSGTNTESKFTNTDSLKYLLIYKKNVAGGDFKYDPIKWSTKALQNRSLSTSSTEDVVRKAFMDQIKSDYTYNGSNCATIGSNFIHACRANGINASSHIWGSNFQLGLVSSFTTGDMFALKSKSFKGAGLSSSKSYDWGLHFWAESGSKQYDPSSGAIHSGDWKSYEDTVITHYSHIAVQPFIYHINKSGQIDCCEAPAKRSHSIGGLDTWKVNP